MSSRFTKTLPTKVYFWKAGENFAGPYVHPQKGRDNIVCEIISVSQEKKTEVTTDTCVLKQGDNISIGTGNTQLNTVVEDIISRYGQTFVRTPYGDFDFGLVKLESK